MSINALQPITHPRALNNSTAVANRKRGVLNSRTPQKTALLTTYVSVVHN